MPRSTTIFACTACGHSSAQVDGALPGLRRVEHARGGARRRRPSRAGSPGRAARARPREPVRLAEVEAVDVERLSTGSEELDRVLGGGLVPGSIVLIGGSPGIGKSTLMSSTLGSARARGPASTLYVSGEESAAQIRLRAERLGADALAVPVLAETSLETVLASLEAERPDVCVIDSVQTLHCRGSQRRARQRRAGARGGRAARAIRARAARRVILVGHVTKEGSLAGPRVLEHAVDCVLQFEGERERAYRVLRALKNRFGSTNEVGVFEMRAGGLTRGGRSLGALRPRGEPAPRAPACCARWRARGRCWWRCRRWSRRPRWCRRAGSRTASTATASASCWRCSRATSAARLGGGPALARARRLRERRRRRAGGGAGRRPRGRAGGRVRRDGQSLPAAARARSPASARSG